MLFKQPVFQTEAEASLPNARTLRRYEKHTSGRQPAQVTGGGQRPHSSDEMRLEHVKAGGRSAYR